MSFGLGNQEDQANNTQTQPEAKPRFGLTGANPNNAFMQHVMMGSGTPAPMDTLTSKMQSKKNPYQDDDTNQMTVMDLLNRLRGMQ